MVDGEALLVPQTQGQGIHAGKGLEVAQHPAHILLRLAGLVEDIQDVQHQPLVGPGFLHDPVGLGVLEGQGADPGHGNGQVQVVGLELGEGQPLHPEVARQAHGGGDGHQEALVRFQVRACSLVRYPLVTPGQKSDLLGVEEHAEEVHDALDDIGLLQAVAQSPQEFQGRGAIRRLALGQVDAAFGPGLLQAEPRLQDGPLQQQLEVIQPQGQDLARQAQVGNELLEGHLWFTHPGIQQQQAADGFPPQLTDQPSICSLLLQVGPPVRDPAGRQHVGALAQEGLEHPHVEQHLLTVLRAMQHHAPGAGFSFVQGPQAETAEDLQGFVWPLPLGLQLRPGEAGSPAPGRDAVNPHPLQLGGLAHGLGLGQEMAADQDADALRHGPRPRPGDSGPRSGRLHQGPSACHPEPTRESPRGCRTG